MLLEEYAASGRLINSNFASPGPTAGRFAYRGDWALVGDFDQAPNDRRPPREVLTQAVGLTTEGSILFLAGALARVELLRELLALDAERLDESFLGILFARDVGKPVSVVEQGALFHIFPYSDTLVFNEILDLLYLEKSDLKGMSPEGKVEEVYRVARAHSFKHATETFQQVLDARIEPKQLDRVGAV